MIDAARFDAAMDKFDAAMAEFNKAQDDIKKIIMEINVTRAAMAIIENPLRGSINAIKEVPE